MIQNWLSPNKIIIYNNELFNNNNFCFLFKNKKILLVYDFKLKSKKEFIDIYKLIENLSKQIRTYQITEEPTEKSLHEFLNCKIDYNLVISIGGGSTIDTAKIFSLKLNKIKLTRNINDLIEEIKIASKFTNHISFPTTCGTGSEVTPYSVIKIDNKKFTFKDDKLIPDFAILNPKFIEYISDNIKIPIVIDALAHAYESLTSKISNIEVLSFTSIPVINGITNELLSKNQNNLKLLVYSYMAGISISNGGTSIIHAFGQSLASNLNIPHGLSIALFFQKIIENTDKKLINEINKNLSSDFKKSINLIYQKYKKYILFDFTNTNIESKEKIFELCYHDLITTRMKSIKKYPTKFSKLKIKKILKEVILD